MKVEELESLEIETEHEIDKVLEFFNKRKIKIHSNKLKETKNIKIYYAFFESNHENLSILSDIVQNEYDIEQGIKIHFINTSNVEKNVKKYLNAEKGKKIISYNHKYEIFGKLNFIKQTDTVGIEFINHDILKKQRNAVSFLIRKMGTNILLGKSILNISLPINIYDERSLLDAFIYGWGISSYYLDIAVNADKLERLKLTSAFLLSLNHVSLSFLKPFNPTLGETFQCKIKETLYYLEQTSHQPPIYNFLIIHPKYKCYGYNGLVVSSRANSVTVKTTGKFNIDFHDGVKYTYSLPKCIIHGLTTGRRFINFIDNFIVDDMTNGLKCVIRLNPDDRGLFEKIFTAKKTFPDYFKGFIAKIEDIKYNIKKDIYSCENNNITSQCEGEWSNYINFDEKTYWEQGNPLFDIFERQDFTLPSDSTYREDIVLMKNGLLDLAQHAKINLEEKQRNDKKLREKKFSF